MGKGKNDLLDDLEFLTSEDDVAVNEEDEEEESLSDEWDSDMMPYYAEPETENADDGGSALSEEGFYRKEDLILTEDDFNDSAGSCSAEQLEFLTGDAEIIEQKSFEYDHSRARCLLATMKLGISLEAPVLSHFPEWEKTIRDRMEYYFRHVYSPHLEDEELFLPKKYLPYEAVDAAQDLTHGKSNDKAIGKYLMNHKGPIVIEVGDVYENFSAHSWMLKFWMIDIKNFNFILGGK